MATLEAAASIALLVTVAGLIVGAIATVATYIKVVDTAGAAARAHAIGQDFVPARGSVAVREVGGVVEVTASAPAMFMEVRATARFPAEVSDRGAEVAE
ncbi:hypothetical protein B843_01570 [Corynebacterium vitaeruminis DSM 20294]|uniref:Uncharacterized protein n=2 Tax=Corynebacterium vitaeruminis TaxID=38305 RepID=W5XXF3_9CORY|nr:hypothetical protein B843_01570 [Corynebacterium vitaeruminis DSM 20294]